MWTKLLNCSPCLKRQLLTEVLFVILLTSCLCSTNAAFVDKLRREIREIYSNGFQKPIEKSHEQDTNSLKVISVSVIAGRMFKQNIEDLIGKGKYDVKINEATKDSLPNWLTFEESRNHLIGLALPKDIGKYKMKVNFTTKEGEKEYEHFELDVVSQQEQFSCSNGLPVTTASLVFNANIKNLNGKNRVKILRKLAHFVDIGVHEMVLIPGNALYTLFDNSDVLTAGPGDSLKSKEPGITLVWKVKCGTDIIGQRIIQTLKSSAGNGAIRKIVGLPVVGWYCSSKHKQRLRRQIFPQPTPRATPSITVPVPRIVTSIGTPIVSPSPSVVKSSTVLMITPTPVSSTVVVVTRVPTTRQPVTQPPPTTLKSTTEEPTTKQPEIVTEKPEIVTEKPTTVTEKPTTVTEKPTTITEKPMTVTEKPMTVTRKPPVTQPTIPSVTQKSTNGKPKLLNSIDIINVYVGEAMKYRIPDAFFIDTEDDREKKDLKLELKKINPSGISQGDQPWIQFDKNDRIIYLLPEPNNKGRHAYMITATDSGGLSENAVFDVIITDENILFTTIFNITITNNYDKFVGNVKNKVNFIHTVAVEMGVYPNEIRKQRFYKGSVIMEFGCTAFSNDPCNSVEAEAYKVKLSKLSDTQIPNYIVSHTDAVTVQECLSDHLGDSSYAARTADKRWWEMILVPVIVISTLLLIIGFVFFFLYRRKRRYEPHREDKNTYLFHKKPVIFREEFSEKPDLISLEPLILPNEKPPLTNPAYEPRTPDGDENASSASSVSDEKPPLTKDSPPQSPRVDSPSRIPYSRSPPPYSGP